MSIDNSQAIEIQTWVLFSRKIKSFENKANIDLFISLYKEDADRLIKHFIFDCNRKVLPFLTYLTTEQSNLLLIYIVNLEPGVNLQ